MFGKRKRSTKITIETHELTTVRLRHGPSGFNYCPECDRNVPVLVSAQAAQMFGVDEHFVNDLYASNQIHQLVDGVFCGNSLTAYFK